MGYDEALYDLTHTFCSSCYRKTEYDFQLTLSRRSWCDKCRKHGNKLSSRTYKDKINCYDLISTLFSRNTSIADNTFAALYARIYQTCVN